MRKTTTMIDTADKPENVPYIVYERELARQEGHVARLWKALIVSIIVNVLIVAGFLIYLNQYDFMSYEQDGEGVNIIGNLNGVDYNGPASKSSPKEESFDG